MPFNFMDNVYTPGPRKLEPASIERCVFVDQLQPGQNTFLPITAFWAHPETDELYLDATRPGSTAAQLKEDDESLMYYARIVSYMGAYVADVVHIAEFLRDERDEKIQYCDVHPSVVKELLKQSVPITETIENSIDLSFFNAILRGVYSEEACLTPIEVMLVDTIEDED